MKVSEILQILRNYKVQSANRYGISRLGIFGSYARGNPTQKSDIDIVIELQSPDLFKMVHIKEDLEELLGVQVDIVRSRKKMNPYLKKRIEKEALYV